MSVRIRRMGLLCGVALTQLALLAPAFSQSVTLANDTPNFVKSAQNLGPESPSTPITVTLWLQQRNTAMRDELAREMYQPGSANYHKFITPEQYNASFGPLSQQADTVKSFLTSHNLSVVATEPNNQYIQAQGTVAEVQSAFNVQINRYSVNGSVVSANANAPTISGSAAPNVAAVSMSTKGFQSYTAKPFDPETGKPFAGAPVADGKYFEGQCFRPPQTVNFNTNGGLPAAQYSGNRYGADPTNINLGHLPPCGYQPDDIYSAYNLKPLYGSQLDGRNQTVVIVDAYGSDTIQGDLAAFSQAYGLPGVNSANFNVYYPGGYVTCGADCIAGNWNIETTLDVEWAHAIAPHARIALVIAKSNSFADLNTAVLYAINNHIGNVISNSYGAPEAFLDPSLLDQLNTTNEMGAMLGISVNFSSGDYGDFSTVYGVKTVSAPADSPWATSVGGTSLALNSSKGILFQTGWGNNETRIADVNPNPPVVPPLHLGFIYGAGGGASSYFPKPNFQSNVPGATRQQPDVSWDADPYTGVEIWITDPSSGVQLVEVIGGTSLSCPMFSGLWAIANQKAGRPLGLAADYVYNLGGGAIADVLPVSSPNDVSGYIVEPGYVIPESAQALAQPLYNTTQFYSALYHGTSTRWYVLTFGTDTSLTTNKGWDNVTGVGTPFGWQFVNAIH